MAWYDEHRVLSDGTDYYGPHVMGEYYDAITNTRSWLYGPWSKEKLDTYEVLRSVPLFGDYMDYLLDVRSNSEYLNRYGMGYSDIHDPRKLRQSESGTRLVGSTYSFVSRNVNRLYR